jgi:DNA-binding NarL/FixJ family response regulator
MGDAPNDAPAAFGLANGDVRFLIVDDHCESREALRELLQARGHAVVAEAADGRGAVDAAARFAPDAVLLDIRLGGESGIDVARALTEAWPELRILLLSVDIGTSPAVLHACGARGFVSKHRLHTIDLAAVLQD